MGFKWYTWTEKHPPHTCSQAKTQSMDNWGYLVTTPPPHPTTVTFETTKSCHIEGRLLPCGVDQHALANVFWAILSIKYSTP